MSLLLDIKYIKLLSFQLSKFEQKKQLLFNSRCISCGDSKKNNFIKRLYFFPDKKQSFFIVKCHNCGLNTSLSSFLKNFFPVLYKDYLMEKIKNKKNDNDNDINIPNKKNKKSIRFKRNKFIQRIDQLDDDHIAIKYLLKRKIPKSQWSRLCYSNDFKSLCNSLDKDFKVPISDERLVIPFFNKNNKLFAFQGRELKKSNYRYITFKLDEYADKIYGMECLNNNKTINIVEGPLDSLFIDNCIATADSCLYNYDGDRYIYDNQPRNIEICSYISKTIELGKNVVIWPEHIKYKDINDMIVYGNFSLIDINNIIKERTFRGVKAKLELSKWKQI